MKQRHLLLLAILATACSKRDAAPAVDVTDPLLCNDCNLVVISLTTLRRDHVGLYGYPRATTPTLDGFFADGWRFDNAFAPTSWTLPVAASLASGQFPYSHGLMDRYDGSRLADDVLTLAEVLHAGGFRTGALTGGGDYNRRFNLTQGFGDYVDEANYHHFGIMPLSEGRRAHLAYLGLEQLVPHANDWLEAHHRERFFLFLQGYDAHCPFTPDPGFRDRFDADYTGTADFSHCLWTLGRVEPKPVPGGEAWPVQVSAPGAPTMLLSPRDVEHMVALYDAEIAQVDAALAALIANLRRLDLVDKTVFVLMAEHGDLFGEHGRFMRGGPLHGTFYDPVLNFPLVIKHPRATGTEVPALVQTVDLLPTLADLLGVDDPQHQQRQGRSFLGLLRGDAAPINEHVFAGARYAACHATLFSGMSVAEMVRGLRWKLVREEDWDTTSGGRVASTEMLYDLEADPGEDHDVASAHPAKLNELRTRLDARFPRKDPMTARCAEKKGQP